MTHPTNKDENGAEERRDPAGGSDCRRSDQAAAHLDPAGFQSSRTGGTRTIHLPDDLARLSEAAPSGHLIVDEDGSRIRAGREQITIAETNPHQSGDWSQGQDNARFLAAAGNFVRTMIASEPMREPVARVSDEPPKAEDRESGLSLKGASAVGGAETPCQWAGGNDSMCCLTCGAEYDYRREDRPACPRLVSGSEPEPLPPRSDPTLIGMAKAVEALKPFADAADRADNDAVALGQGDGWAYDDDVVVDPILPSGETPTLCALGDFRRAREALATLSTPSQERPGDGWQPIETAPRTSNSRLVWCPERQNTYVVSWGKVGGFLGAGGWQHFGGSGRDLTEEPTHWRPLPAPPVSARPPS